MQNLIERIKGYLFPLEETLRVAVVSPDKGLCDALTVLISTKFQTGIRPWGMTTNVRTFFDDGIYKLDINEIAVRFTLENLLIPEIADLPDVADDYHLLICPVLFGGQIEDRTREFIEETEQLFIEVSAIGVQPLFLFADTINILNLPASGNRLDWSRAFNSLLAMVQNGPSGNEHGLKAGGRQLITGLYLLFNYYFKERNKANPVNCLNFFYDLDRHSGLAVGTDEFFLNLFNQLLKFDKTGSYYFLTGSGNNG